MDSFGKMHTSNGDLANPRYRMIAGTLVLPLALVTLTLAILAIGVTFWQQRLNQSIQSNTELDACTAKQARLLSSTLNRLIWVNREIQATRLLLDGAKLTADPPLAIALAKTLVILAIERSAIEGRWKIAKTQWTAQLTCPGAIHSPIAEIPWKKLPPDGDGPTPWIWIAPPRFHFKVQLISVRFHHPGGHCALVQENSNSPSVLSFLNSTWTAAWSGSC